MSFGHTYDDWQEVGASNPHGSCSPNLSALLEELQRRWPYLTNLGCFGTRPIRGSQTVPSSHSYGAAIDIGYPGDRDPEIAAAVAPWIVARSEELHVGAVHDYRRCRIWHAGRTPGEADACTLWWRAQRPSASTGMGQVWANHLHVETTVAGWSDGSVAIDRWVE